MELPVGSLEGQIGHKEQMFIDLEKLEEAQEESTKIEHRLTAKFQALRARPADTPKFAGLERLPRRDASEVSWARCRFAVHSQCHPEQLAVGLESSRHSCLKLQTDVQGLILEETAVLSEIQELEKYEGLGKDLNHRLGRLRSIQRSKFKAEQELDHARFGHSFSLSRQGTDLLGQLESGRCLPAMKQESWLLHSLVQYSAHQTELTMVGKKAVKQRSVPVKFDSGRRSTQTQVEIAKRIPQDAERKAPVELPSAAERLLRYKKASKSTTFALLKHFFLHDWQDQLVSTSIQYPKLPRMAHEVLPLLEPRSGDHAVELQVRIPATMIFSGNRFIRSMHNSETDKIVTKKAEPWETMLYIMDQLRDRASVWRPTAPEYIVKRFYQDGVGSPIQATLPATPDTDASRTVVDQGPRHPPEITGSFWQSAIPLSGDDLLDILRSFDACPDGTITMLQRFIPSLHESTEVLRLVQTPERQRRFLVAALKSKFADQGGGDSIDKKMALQMEYLDCLDRYRIEELSIVPIVDGHTQFTPKHNDDNLSPDFMGKTHSEAANRKISPGDEEHPWSAASRVMVAIWNMLESRGANGQLEPSSVQPEPQIQQPVSRNRKQSKKGQFQPKMVAADFMLDSSSQVLLLQVKDILWQSLDQ